MHYFNKQYIRYNPLSATTGEWVYFYPKHKKLLPIDFVGLEVFLMKHFKKNQEETLMVL